MLLDEGLLCNNQLTKWAGNTDRSKEFSVIVKWNFLIKGKFYQTPSGETD